MKTARDFLNEFDSDKIYNVTLLAPSGGCMSIATISFNDTKKLMEEYANQSKWIPVSERLPEHYNPVLLGYEGSDDYQIGVKNDKIINSCKFTNTDGTSAINATHWQPLPAPPNQ